MTDTTPALTKTDKNNMTNAKEGLPLARAAAPPVKIQYKKETQRRRGRIQRSTLEGRDLVLVKGGDVFFAPLTLDYPPYSYSFSCHYEFHTLIISFQHEKG
jgi:hypothetical protein